MRIRKQYQVIPTNAKLENGDSTSATNGYVAEYINDHSVVVSAVEPSGNARKKVWKQYSENVLFPTLTSSGTTISTSNCNVSLSGDEFTFSATGTDMLWGNVTNAGSPYYNQYGLLIPIPANATKVYLLTTNSEFNRNFVDFYDSNKSSLGYFQITNEVSIPANAKYVNVRIGKLDSVSGTTYKTKIQLSFNPITTYEPYVEDKEYVLNNNVYEEFNPQNEIENYQLDNLPSHSGGTNSYILQKTRNIVNLSVDVIWFNNITANTWVTIGTLPSTLKPNKNIVVPTYFSIGTTGAVEDYGKCGINNDGTIKIKSHSTLSGLYAVGFSATWFI